MLRQSQTRRLSELETLAFRKLSEAQIPFPYKVVQLKKILKDNALKLKKGNEVIGVYKTSDDVINNFVENVRAVL